MAIRNGIKWGNGRIWQMIGKAAREAERAEQIERVKAETAAGGFPLCLCDICLYYENDPADRAKWRIIMHRRRSQLIALSRHYLRNFHGFTAAECDQFGPECDRVILAHNDAAIRCGGDPIV